MSFFYYNRKFLCIHSYIEKYNSYTCMRKWYPSSEYSPAKFQINPQNI